MINHLVSQRYEVLEKIGEGPLFTVYKARDKVMNRIIVLKTVAGAFTREPAFVNGLQRGLAASANLNHPNIARFYEWGEDDGTFYEVVEFVRGIDLKERIRRIAPFTLSVAVDVACALGEALQYTHAQGQIHGDLRPHNIIISPEGVTKVTDFGVMAGVAQSARAQADVMVRAATYQAPELLPNQAGTVAGDLYAVGAILYEMLTGTPLYAGDSLETVADMHAYSPIPLPRVINPGVPRSLEGITIKCLQKRPEARYHSAGELLTDLKSVRDALRFGKPLSWSPIDVDKLANDVPVRREEEEKKRRKEEERGEGERRKGKGAPVGALLAAPNSNAASSTNAAPAKVGDNRKSKIENPEHLNTRTPEHQTPVSSLAEPVADAAASSLALPMPAKNRLRQSDERVSIVLKIAIGVVTSIIFGCLIVLAGIYGSKWVEPETVIVPQIVGKSIDAARTLAQQKKLHLIEHTEYSNRPRGIVFRTDENVGAKLHEGHDINIWYSKGPTYVAVPNVVRLSREQATQKLKEAGLTQGKVTPEYNDKIPVNTILRQNVSYKKIVLHDTAVDLVYSDGPKPDYGTDPGADTGSTNMPDPTPPQPNPDSTGDTSVSGDTSALPDRNTAADPNANPNPPDDPGNSDAHEFHQDIHIQKDGRGKRKVRIEFVDANGLSITPVLDEMHGEGDRIPLTFTYYGKKIRLRIYYNDVLSLSTTFDPAKTQHQAVH